MGSKNVIVILLKMDFKLMFRGGLLIKTKRKKHVISITLFVPPSEPQAAYPESS